MSEQQIQKKITKWLEDNGCYVVKVISASKSGIPDLLVCTTKGYFIGIEVKRPETRNNVSKLQEYNIDKIEATGGYALVAWNVEMVEEYFHEYELLD